MTFLFLGQRDSNPVYDALQFDLGFPKGNRPYLIPLRKDIGSPFIPQPKPESEEAKATKKGKEELKPEGPLRRRRWPFGRHRDRACVPGRGGPLRPHSGRQGKALFSYYQVEGSRYRDGSDTPRGRWTAMISRPRSRSA